MNIGFIGAGNIAGAIAKGASDKNVFDNIYIYDVDFKKASMLAESCGGQAVESPHELADAADVYLLAVKPIHAENALGALKTEGKAIISVVAGLDIERLKKYAPGARYLRVMPNTPLMVGEGASAFSADYTLTEAEFEFAKRIFSAIGTLNVVDAELMPAVVGVSGSGPAYMYLFAEAVAKAGVEQGMDEKTATELAAQTMLGAAKMILKGEKTPHELCVDVCSPGGTTIEAVKIFEEDAQLQKLVEKAVAACVKRAKEL